MLDKIGCLLAYLLPHHGSISAWKKKASDKKITDNTQSNCLNACFFVAHSEKTGFHVSRNVLKEFEKSKKQSRVIELISSSPCMYFG